MEVEGIETPGSNDGLREVDSGDDDDNDDDDGGDDDC